MTQNIYDDPQFFHAYSRLGRSVTGLDGAAEWPALRALLPGLRGKRVVDLGCGFGWFCRWAVEQGAAEVLGIDVSDNMLVRARTMTESSAIRYQRADLETVRLDAAAFDVAYSSLAFHYVDGFETLSRRISAALRPGGELIFSVEHPIYTAPERPGWVTVADGRATWPVDSYLLEGARKTDWLAEGVIKRHRTIGTYLNLLISAGFVIRHVEEWGPTAEQIAATPALALDRQRPIFLLVAARRPPAPA